MALLIIEYARLRNSGEGPVDHIEYAQFFVRSGAISSRNLRAVQTAKRLRRVSVVCMSPEGGRYNPMPGVRSLTDKVRSVHQGATLAPSSSKSRTARFHTKRPRKNVPRITDCLILTTSYIPGRPTPP